MVVYRLAKIVGFPIFHLFFRIKVTGAKNVPKTGGAIICANHANALDPIFVALAVKRELRFISKKELFQKKSLSLLIRSLGAFPVDRENTDITAYKTAIKLLQNNEALLLFSQGSRKKTIDISNTKTGVAFFGIKAKSPIVPLGISTSYKLFSKVTIHIGKPIYLDQYYNARLKTDLLNEITEETMSQILKLTGEN